MKKIIIFVVIFGFLSFGSWTLAQENQNSATSSAIDEDKVKALKEKLATQVAQLRDNQKRGFFGEVATISKTSFTLVTANGEIKVRFTEDTLVFKVGKGRTSAEIADVKNGMTVSVLGLYDEQSKQHNAKVIIIQTQPIYTVGEITEIDKKNAAITLKTANSTVAIDYERATTAQEYTTSTKSFAKSGLSRLVSGDVIMVWGEKNEDDNKKINALRVVRVPKDALSPTKSEEETNKPSPIASSSAQPKTSSKPLPKATPAASPKASPKPTTTP